MSVEAAGSNYMSDAEIMAWMESKTEGLYGAMRDSMDVAQDRSDLESGLGDLKQKLAGTQDGTVSADQVFSLVKDLLDKSQAFPEVHQMLQTMSDQLAAGQKASQTLTTTTINVLGIDITGPVRPPAFAIAASTVTSWTSQITDKLDVLGKQDQLGLINIQDVNSQINQTKQIASNLIDAENKSASAVVANIRA
jgi:hypothetical protein